MPEFDEYADEYRDLVHDPIRETFAPGSHFFFERKWILLRAYLDRYHLKSQDMAWLDVGCGQGDLLRIGASAFRRAAGCDVSPKMLESAKGLDVKVQEHPETLPYPDGQFDLVTAVCVFHHVVPESRPGLIAEMARMLRPGGAAAIIEHNPLNPATQLIVKRLPVDRDAQLLTAGTARRLLRQGGLTHRQTEYFLYFPESLYRRKLLAKCEAAFARIPAGGQYAVFSCKS